MDVNNNSLTDKEYTKAMLTELRKNNIPLHKSKMTIFDIAKRKISRDSLDTYYVSFINDILKQIRLGGVDFAFKPEHIETLLLFEPNIEVVYRDGIFYISLPCCEARKSKNKIGG